MLAILSDIHANRQALDAVLADALSYGATRWVVLGDIIGFGGDPVFCAERIRTLGAVVLRGNHEAALAEPTLFAAFPAVQRMTERTRALLPPALFDWLTTLPLVAEADGMVLTHATFHSPERWGRLSQPAEAARSFAAQTAPLALFGHTHRPTLFRQLPGILDQLPITYDEAGNFVLRSEAGTRYMVNPGSVGQPRDGDPRAAYALWDGGTLTLRRVAYDVETAAAETRSMGLPENFAASLRQGRSPL